MVVKGGKQQEKIFWKREGHLDKQSRGMFASDLFEKGKVAGELEIGGMFFPHWDFGAHLSGPWGDLSGVGTDTSCRRDSTDRRGN